MQQSPEARGRFRFYVPRRNDFSELGARPRMSLDRFGQPRPAGRQRGYLAVLGLALALVLVGCTTGNPQSTLDPKGPFARHVYELFSLWIFWPAVFVFVAVEGILIYTVWRFRAREGAPLPVQTHGNTGLEITWTIIPAVILLVILAVTFNTQATLAQPPNEGTPINVRVIGHQWWWEFEYTDLGVSTANELHIPVGSTVNIHLESADVIHSFWVPHLAGKTDAIPGRVNKLWLQADEAGTYNGQCAEFCGIEHALMRLVVVAQSPSEFNAWVQNERCAPAILQAASASTPAATPIPLPTGCRGYAPQQGASTSLVSQGAQLFSTGACITCHTVRGTGASGKVGPELTHFGSRSTIAANTLESTTDNLKRWLRNPQAVKPGALMPNLNLSEQDIEALAAYLQSLR